VYFCLTLLGWNLLFAKFVLIDAIPPPLPETPDLGDMNDFEIEVPLSALVGRYV